MANRQPPEKYQIFISYRRQGGDVYARLLRDRLRLAGYVPFYDIEDVSNGRFNDQLFRRIDECEDVLVLLPKDGLDRCANEGDWVRLEVAYAIEHKKNLIPVMLSGFEWKDNLPADIADLPNYQGVIGNMDYFDAMFERILKLLKSLPSFSGEIRIPTTPVKPWYKKIWFWLLAVLAVIGILLFTFLKPQSIPTSEQTAVSEAYTPPEFFIELVNKLTNKGTFEGHYTDTDAETVYMRTLCSEDGNIYAWGYFDSNNTLKKSALGNYAVFYRTYNANGAVESESYYDADGRLILNADGFAKSVWNYDDSGRCQSQIMLAADSETPILSSYGYAYVTWEYDENGLCVCQSFLLADGKTPVRWMYGYSFCTWEYDEENRAKTQCFLDENRSLIDTGYGYAKAVWEYDSLGRCVSQSFYDKNGKLTETADGYAKVEWSYDENGTATEKHLGISEIQPDNL